MTEDSRKLGDSVNLMESPLMSPERMKLKFRDNYMLDSTPDPISQSERADNGRHSELIEMGTPITETIDPEEEIKTNRMLENRKPTISRFSNLNE